MDTLKIEQLAEVTRLIQQKWGQQALQSLQDYKAAYQFTVIATGIADLDAVIEGIPCGYLTLLHGIPTSGMTTLTYRLIAAAQSEGQIIVYVDLSDTFDGEYSVLNCGVDENRLLLIKPNDLVEALTLTRDVMTLPYRGLLVLDAALTDIAAHVLAQGLERLRVPLRQSAWTVVGLFPPAARSICQPAAALQLFMRRSEWIVTHDRISGFWSLISILKHQTIPQTEMVTFAVCLEGEGSC